ncbi:unnamed protein product [Pneumocystis jirovecii]|uniref:Uncharacterized protein n=2 Tax=Pneumocystis jirovecii TaxID=42068 RepID=L0P791_PNEJI|nr:uncharacterized protein T551_01099 [Pneumocystis jirovecii RU7]KTW31838.1 hypothetical protein T551_01099 [Pneumocystis jirovecii RU7]CCJ28092.1 unnamed protein product [Pneumocystis jirovecii]
MQEVDQILKDLEKKKEIQAESEPKKQAKKIRRCGTCKKIGHSRNICPENRELNTGTEWNTHTETFCGMITPGHGKSNNTSVKNSKKRKPESNGINILKTPTNTVFSYTNATQTTPCSIAKNKFRKKGDNDNLCTEENNRKESVTFSHVHPLRFSNDLDDIIPPAEFLFPYEGMKWYETMEYSVDFENIQPDSRKDMLAFCKFNSYKKINYEDILNDSPLFKPLPNSIFDFIDDEIGSKSPVLNF